MLHTTMFEAFAKKTPVSVMVQATMERILSPQRLDELFERISTAQYTRQLAFSTLADLIGSVVMGKYPSVHAAYKKSMEEVGVSVTAVYDKLQRLSTDVSEAMVRETAAEMAELIEAMPGDKLDPFVPGYRTKILDGNCLAASEHRISELRQTAAGPLPGKSLVVLDPQLQLVIDVFACEDGHAQERSLLDRVLQSVEEKDLWVADRNFCTNGFVCGIAARNACFIIRLHQGLAYETTGPWREIGATDTGFAFERTVRIQDEHGQWINFRLVRLNLGESTRDGDDELFLLTNLPEAAANAIAVAGIYRNRWLLETVFMHLTQSLCCEIRTLGYPKAALFGFCMAILAYNVLAVTRAALRAKWGEEASDEKISLHYLADEIAGTQRGMMIALPEEAWQRYQTMSLKELAKELVELAGQVNLKVFRKHPRGPKKPRPPRTQHANKPHVSTKRLLDGRRKR